MTLMRVVFILALTTALVAQGADQLVAHAVGEHWGYLATVAEERNLRVIEMVIIDNPVQPEVPLGVRIFVPELSKEFQERYEQQFGRTDVEQNLNTPNRFYTYEYSTGVRVNAEEDVAKERSYGEYMVRRLTEHHVDQYAQRSPNLKPVYELKERISNVKVEVRKGYKVKIHYSLSGNYFDFVMENPYDIATKVILQMDPDSFGPGKIDETTLHLGYELTTTVSMGSDYALNQGMVSLAGYKKLRENLTTSLTGSTHPSDEEKESRLIIGLSWTH